LKGVGDMKNYLFFSLAKIKGFGVILLLLAAQLAIAEKTYLPNSIIIPMDTTYQDNGMFKAYGLVYKLLQNGIPIDWTIKTPKNYGDIDFSVSSVRTITSSGFGGTTFSASYRGGPFVIESTYYAQALPIVQAWIGTYPSVAAHRAEDAFSANLSRRLESAPTISVFLDGNELIAFTYLNAASIPMSNGATWPTVNGPSPSQCPFPNCMSETQLAGTIGVHPDGALFDSSGNPIVCQLMSMHYQPTNNTLANEVALEVRDFLTGRPTHCFFECEAINWFENLSTAGPFISTNRLLKANKPGSVDYLNSSRPFAQADGPFTPIGGSIPALQLAAGSSYYSTITVMVKAAGSNIGVKDVWLTDNLDGNPNNGKVSYLGGHQYSVTLPISTNGGSQGTRYFLNSLFEAPCSSEASANITTILYGPTSTGNPQVTYTIHYSVTDGYAYQVLITFPLPGGVDFVSASNGGVYSNGTVTWNLGTLPPNSSGDLTVTINFNTEGSYDFTAYQSWYVGTTQHNASSNTITTEYTYDSDGDGIPNSVEGNSDPDNDGIPNYLDLDSDGDGILDSVEWTNDFDNDGTPNYLDLDSDGDGIPDSVEGAGDADGDGAKNFLDLDSDNDGILDTVEGYGDTDGDGIPDYLDLDSDGDGVWDLIEGNDSNHNGQNDNTQVQDTNNDGRIDSITDINLNGVDDSYDSTPAAVQNTDGDLFPDFQDPDDDGDGIPTTGEDANSNGHSNDDDSDSDGTPNYLDPDSDNDGILDAVEGANDLADGGDGLGNYIDLDSDGDGIPDQIEGTGDRDGDGTPNYLDPDSDGDGIPDSVETANDFDNDGIPNYLDLDSDADGLPDSVEGTYDADGDGAPNFLDPDYPPDTDSDGIPDAQESSGDSDGDGVPNYLDWDSDNDGIPDSIEGSGDLDGDGIPNYLDLDSDGDGAFDLNEGNDSNFDGENDNTSVQDTNNDGRIDTINDTNGNGLDDSYETNPAILQDRDQDGIPDIWDTDDDGDGIPTKVEDANNDGNPANDDADGDGIPNYLDFDSDGDGKLDSYEGTYDSDGDTIPDYLDPDSSQDSDGDGIPDFVEGSFQLDDFDGDGTENFLDLDSDGDGIPDSVEGAGDKDGDGAPNFLDLDSDGDGILDSVEGTGDADGDGIPNYLDIDSDGDGISDGKEGTSDFDSDGIPNYLDLDSDGDGFQDEVEGIYDGDRDGNPDFLDPNSYPPPHLLRNDEVISLSSYDPSQIFIQAYPLDPALDPVGPNKIAQEGEGAKRELNGSADDDDFYKSYVPSTWIDPDPTVLNDSGRPLVFYELTSSNCTLFLSKDGSNIKITYTCQ